MGESSKCSGCFMGLEKLSEMPSYQKQEMDGYLNRVHGDPWLLQNSGPRWANYIQFHAHPRAHYLWRWAFGQRQRERPFLVLSVSHKSQMAVVQIPGITLEPVQKPHCPKIGLTIHLSLANFFQLHKLAHMSSLGCLPSSSLWTDHLPPWNDSILCCTLSHEKWRWKSLSRGWLFVTPWT